MIGYFFIATTVLVGVLTVSFIVLSSEPEPPLKKTVWPIVAICYYSGGNLNLSNHNDLFYRQLKEGSVSHGIYVHAWKEDNSPYEEYEKLGELKGYSEEKVKYEKTTLALLLQSKHKCHEMAGTQYTHFIFLEPKFEFQKAFDVDVFKRLQSGVVYAKGFMLLSKSAADSYIAVEKKTHITSEQDDFDEYMMNICNLSRIE
jgi:hypothetical protein